MVLCVNTSLGMGKGKIGEPAMASTTQRVQAACVQGSLLAAAVFLQGRNSMASPADACYGVRWIRMSVSVRAWGAS
jgi:hypothetical protein